MREIIKLPTVTDYNNFLGISTHHPLVSVIDASTIAPLRHVRKNIGFYVIYLKDVKCADALQYGRNRYDFQEETLVFAGPRQVIGLDDTGELFQPKGWWLAFQPELLNNTPLGERIKNYNFFSYALNEALHLSAQERQTVIECMMKIEQEIKGVRDGYSNQIIAAAIELLLNYCTRFYDRQFITRKVANSDLLDRFERLMTHYFSSDKPERLGTPTVAYCAEQLHLSANYFGDLIKKETGTSAQEYILAKTMEVAKELLTNSNTSINEVAYSLGYQYPQYFSTAFKRVTGYSPNQYRQLAD